MNTMENKKTTNNEKSTKVLKNSRVVSKNDEIVGTANPEQYIFREEYRNMLTCKRTPISEKGMRMFADEMVQWAITDEKAIRIEAFHLKKGIQSKIYYEWLSKYEDLREAHDHAMNIIGMRTYDKAFNRQAAENIFKHMQYMYDDGWKQATDHHNAQKKELQQDEETVPTVVNVYTNDYSVNDEKSIKGGNE
jgi:hypothetical protein